MKAKRISLAIILVLICVLLTACSTPEGTYKQAQTLLSQSKYAEVAEKFESLGSYEDATTLTMYCKAAAAGETGDYDTAFATFDLLGEYKDSKLMITYYQARQYESTAILNLKLDWDNLIFVAELYDSIALFRDSKDRAEACRKTVYSCAIEWAEANNFDNAIEVLNALEGYIDSAQLSKFYTAFKMEQDGFYAEASAIFAELGDYRNAKEQVFATLDRGYQKAAMLMNEGKYREAYKIYKNNKRT